MTECIQVRLVVLSCEMAIFSECDGYRACKFFLEWRFFPQKAQKFPLNVV